jgi:subtilisin-like proprotein convertase family protein
MLQDDLKDISAKLPYRQDDHGNDTGAATELEFTGTTFFGEGNIEQNTDLDFFYFTMGIEQVVFDIDPFHIGPNLDILAKLVDSKGTVLATSNPRDALDATFSINTPGGVQLDPGTYYISIDGTGKPFTTDPGYTDYGSLGYYSINAVRTSLLDILIGVDFDAPSGSSPSNWTRYTGGGPRVFSDVVNENGAPTPYNLSISTSGTSITSQASTLNNNSVPFHTQLLNGVGGFIVTKGDTWTFTWSDLEPLAVYEVYVFAADDSAGANHVEIAGQNNTISFTQTLAANDLAINSQTGARNKPLSDFARTIQSTTNGRITITVKPEEGAAEAAIAGLAIRPGTSGSIGGVVWNDLNGDGSRDSGEPGLAGWTVYFDDNDNGQRDATFVAQLPSVDVPQPLIDEASVKSELLVETVREILDVNVTLDISHTFDADVNVFLISPSGTRVELFDDIGGFSDNFTNTTLDDEAPTSIGSASAPFTGTFRPQQPLSLFDGENAIGTWILEVTDDASTDAGVLNSWSLAITGSEQSTVSNGTGSYTFNDLPPGVYNIREVVQNSWTQTLAQPPVTVSSGGRVTGVNFGNRQGGQPLPGSIAGQVWNDQNDDGVKDSGEPGLAGWTVYIDGNNNGVYDPTSVRTIASQDVPQPIADFATVTSEVLFTGLSAITDVTVTLNITHSFDGDLDAFLISPAGTQVELFSGVGGQFNNFLNTKFDRNAAISIEDGAAPFTGTFRPEGLLSELLGENPNGIWRLLIRDTENSDEGVLTGWSLSITGEEPSATTIADGSYAFPKVVPGDYYVREIVQPGWTQTTAPPLPITVDLSQQITNAHFGNRMQLLSGDYNRDNVVDSADYVLWRKSMGQTVPPFSGADGDGNGTIGRVDYDVWRTNFGETVHGAGTGGSAPAAASFVADTESAVAPVSDRTEVTRRSRPAFDGVAVVDPAARPTGRPRIVPRPAFDGRPVDSSLLSWLASQRAGRSAPSGDTAASAPEATANAEETLLRSIDAVFERLGG